MQNEEVMYGSEQFDKKNGYKRKKPLTPEQKKERLAQKHAKLFERIRKTSTSDVKSTVVEEKTFNSIDDLKKMVQNIENK